MIDTSESQTTARPEMLDAWWDAIDEELAALPANPLLGRAPGSRIELPFFRQSDTTKLRLTKTIAVDASAPVLEIRYAVRNTDRRPIAFCLKM